MLENKKCKNKRVHVVLFDFGGVLSEEGWKKGLRIIAKANGLHPDSFLQTAADTIYETGYILGKGSQSDFWKSLKTKTGIRGDVASLSGELISRFALNDAMMETVRNLKSNNFIVGILSDQTDWLDGLNARFDFFRHFDYVFNSYHLGKGKRDPSLFDDIAGLLRETPENILFIDDDPGNIQRARQKGWKAILYTDFKSFREEINEIIQERTLV